MLALDSSIWDIKKVNLECVTKLPEMLKSKTKRQDND